MTYPGLYEGLRKRLSRTARRKQFERLLFLVTVVSFGYSTGRSKRYNALSYNDVCGETDRKISSSTAKPRLTILWPLICLNLGNAKTRLTRNKRGVEFCKVGKNHWNEYLTVRHLQRWDIFLWAISFSEISFCTRSYRKDRKKFKRSRDFCMETYCLENSKIIIFPIKRTNQKPKN